MVDSTTQATATAPNAPASPVAAGTPAAPDLDALLREFTPKPSAPVPPKTETPPAAPSVDAKKLTEALSYYEQAQQRDAKKSLDEDINKAVSAVKGASDALSGMPDRFVRGALHDLAASDPRFAQAFMQRQQNPEGWNKVLQAAAQEISKDLGAPQTDSIQRNRLAVEAAVRGRQSTAPAPQGAPSNEELSRMNNAQFNRYKQKLAASRR